MKFFALSFLITMLVLPLSVHACPNLAGQYWCVINDGHREPWLDVLTIEQSIDSDSPSITNFTSNYRSIPGGVETFSADDKGIADRWGWITKCTADRVISVTNDFSAMSEQYIDKSDSLVRTFNRKIEQVCSRKK
jgi:hypothetical protein